MSRALVADEQICAMDDYLKGYGLNRKLLRLERYEKTYFGWKATEEDLPGEAPLARARMFEVRQFIMSMPNSDAKLLLYSHYVRGETVEKCAELLGISRASAFRLKKRALSRAVEHRERQQASLLF